MPYNPQKMAKIIHNECEAIEEKCEGYKQKLADTIVEILRLEKDNLVIGTYIQQKVDGECESLSEYLVQNPVKNVNVEGEN